MKEKHYWVYIHTNLKNNKVYIGVTQMKLPELRWGNNGCGYCKHHPHFWSAIQKYGWDNFSHEAWEVDSAEEMWAQEIYLIALYDATNPSKGYNVSMGGSCGSKGYKFSSEECILRSSRMIARWEDSEFRVRVIEALKRSRNDSNRQAHMSKIMKDLWQNPDFRANQSKAISISKKGKKQKPRSAAHSKAISTSRKGQPSNAKGRKWKIGLDGKRYYYDSN